MKSKMIVTCVCLCLLGGSVACSGDEKATAVNAEATKPEAAKAPAAPAKPAKSNVQQKPKAEPAPATDASGSASAVLTNKDCFPDSVPDSAPNNAKLCVILAKSAPDMAFTKRDYDGMPPDCRPIVLPKCRFED